MSIDQLVDVTNLTDDYDIYEFLGADLKSLNEAQWLQFCKANRLFREPGISKEELLVLHTAVKEQFGEAPIRSLETGVCFGTTTRYFTVRTLKFGGEHHAFEVMVRPKFKEVMEQFGLWDKFTLHGHSIRDDWHGGDIDVLYIDSEHAICDALGEYMRFRVFLHGRSLVGFHDTDTCPGVARAIEMIQEVDELELVGEYTKKLSAGMKFFKVKCMNRTDQEWNKRA
jgi:hypothetical protein